MLIIFAPDLAAQTPRSYLNVNTSVGSDSTGDGSLALPYKSLNKALQAAYHLRYTAPNNPCTDNPQPVDLDVVIRVKTPAVPISPSTHGGFETSGWLTYKQDCQQTSQPAFPIRLIERVTVEGVRSGGLRAKVAIDDLNGSNPFNWGSTTQPQRSYFHGASSATLFNLHLDGTLYTLKNSHRPNAVFAEQVQGFSISRCRIEDLYDGLYFQADAPQDSVSCTVTDSELISLGPIDIENPVSEDQGHSACWMVGSGSLDISFSTTWFEGSHDAIEVAGDDMTDGRLSVTGCTFFRNENGIEAVGSGQLVAAISDCNFESNYNLPGGMPLTIDGIPNSPGAIAARSMANTITVRSSSFLNNAFHFIVSTTGTYDFGESAASGPGNNGFSFDFSPWSQQSSPPDPIRVAMYVKNPAAVVLAGGNTWWPLNQGANAAGCLTGTKVGFPVGHPDFGLNNLFPAPMNPLVIAPPGPMFGYCCETGSDPWRRNFSLEPGASISFGSDCLP